MPLIQQNTKNKGRLLARLVWDLLQQESFETLADLTDALKFRCAKLRIQWTNDEINDAYRLVEYVRPLVPSKVEPRRNHVEQPQPAGLSRDEAFLLFDQLGLE